MSHRSMPRQAIVDAVIKYEGTASVLEQGTATLRLLISKDGALKAKALQAGAKTDWLRSAGGGSLSTRLGFTSRKNKSG